MNPQLEEQLSIVQAVRLYFGGPELKDSFDIIRIMCYFTPICIVASVLADAMIAEFRCNFIIIFTRTGKREHYYKQIIEKTISYLVVYHILAIIVIVAIERPAFTGILSEWIQAWNVILVSFLQYLTIILLNQVIFLYLEDPFSSLIGYVMLVLPIFIVGLLYKNGSSLLNVILWAPFNQGIYNFQRLHVIGILYQVILIGTIYYAGYYKIKNYEVM